MLNFRIRGDELDLNPTFSIFFKNFSIFIKNGFISSNLKYAVVLYVSSTSLYFLKSCNRTIFLIIRPYENNNTLTN